VQEQHDLADDLLVDPVGDDPPGALYQKILPGRLNDATGRAFVVEGKS